MDAKANHPLASDPCDPKPDSKSARLELPEARSRTGRSTISLYTPMCIQGRKSRTAKMISATIRNLDFSEKNDAVEGEKAVVEGDAFFGLDE